MEGGSWLEIIRKSLTSLNHKLGPGERIWETQITDSASCFHALNVYFLSFSMSWDKNRVEMIGKQKQKFDEVQS